jgi:hypothetical protein
MATITTLRPSATSSGVGWSAEPSGTLDEVTSDDNDATYAEWSGAGSALILPTPLDAPPTGERRHVVRLEARGEDGDAWWAVRTNLGALVAGAAGSFGASPETIAGSWQAGVPAEGSIVLSCYVTGQSLGVKITELYLEVDSRLAPTFTPQILDGTGSSTVTVSDTVTPTVRAAALDTDGLVARQYRYWVTLNGAIIWDTGIVSGSPVNRITDPLDNGSYVAHLQVWSTLGSNTAYPSDEETLAFTVSVGEVPTPDAPVVSDIPDTPFFGIEVCAPSMTAFDDYTGWIEVQRVDCPLGGYLALTGTAGSNATAPDLVDTVLYSFDSTASPWVGEGTATVARVTSPVHDGTGALEATKPFAGTGFDEVRFNDNQGSRDLTANGPTLSAWVYVPAVAGGLGWQARLELQDDAFTWIPGPNFGIEPDTWTRITYTPDPLLLADCRSIGFAIGANDVGGNPDVYVDTVVQGTPPFLDPPTDLQIEVTAGRDDGWRPANTLLDQALVGKYDSAGNQRSWALVLDADGNGDPNLAGRPALLWSTDGTSGAIVGASATERAPIDPFGNVTMRVTLDANNGLGGWTVTFETLNEAGAWVQLGTPISNNAAPTMVFSGDAPLSVGSTFAAGVPDRLFEGRIYSVTVRDPSNGNTYASPDFTGRAPGTDTIMDSTGNVWTINTPAGLVSTMATTSLAILGPLGSDECADVIDYTLPRARVGRACDHAPEPCCSYYRARTVGLVDGALLVSDWSDAWNPGIPVGLIFAWPDTEVSIPQGWRRATELDATYPKGVTNVVTEPGARGGTASHQHTTLDHEHTQSHSHTMTGTTGTANQTFTASDGVAGTLGYLNTHTHTRPANTSVNAPVSLEANPSSDVINNDPARLDVIWIESNGQPLGVPDGGLALMGDIAPAGWATYADATDRFLKGATGDGGATAASSIDSHTHEIAAHTHTGSSHGHTSANTGSTSGNRSFFAGSSPAQWAANHTHPIAIASGVSAPLASESGGTTGAASASPEPPFRKLRARVNTSGTPDLPVGVIGLWRGSLGAIPDAWQLCDGSNGTPDMFGRYPKAATSGIGDTGGSLDSHDHTTANHTHTTTGHSHTTTIHQSGAAVANVLNPGPVTTVSNIHIHTSTDTDAATPTIGDATSGTASVEVTEPVHEQVAFVQLMEEPTPPPAPPTFCLDWDPDEALIRSSGPDGPIWAPVWGRFEWARVRPFTAEVGVMGTRFVTTAPPGGRNLLMTAAVESEAELATLRAVLSRPLVLISPIDSVEVWAAPVAETVKVVKVGRIRQVTASFIGTGPEPPPQLADVGV